MNLGSEPVVFFRFGRDHHGYNFSIWMAGGGMKAGISYGETDDFSYSVVKDGMTDVGGTVNKAILA